MTTLSKLISGFFKEKENNASSNQENIIFYLKENGWNFDSTHFHLSEIEKKFKFNNSIEEKHYFINSVLTQQLNENNNCHLDIDFLDKVIEIRIFVEGENNLLDCYNICSRLDNEYKTSYDK